MPDMIGLERNDMTNAMAEPQVSRPEMDRVLTALSNVIQDLRDEIISLEGKIDPVLTPEEPTVGVDPTPIDRKPQSLVVTILEGAGHDLRVLTFRLNEIKRRCEL